MCSIILRTVLDFYRVSVSVFKKEEILFLTRKQAPYHSSKDSDNYLRRNRKHAAHTALVSHLCCGGTHSWRAYSVSLPTLTAVAVTAAAVAAAAAASLSLCVLFIFFVLLLLLLLLFCFIVLCVHNQHKIR